MSDPLSSSASSRLPWTLHPSLTEERLRFCARLLAHARRDAVAMSSFEMGDDNWSVGCRAYAFGRQRLRRIAGAGTYPWLRVLDESHHFVFLIDQVPVRFYRGPADEPTARTLRRLNGEAEQLSLALGEDVAADGLVFRLAIETNANGMVERVVFLATRGENSPECFWPIPLESMPSDASHHGVAQLRLLPEEGDVGRPRRIRPTGRGGVPAPALLRRQTAR